MYYCATETLWWMTHLALIIVALAVAWRVTRHG